MGSLYLNQLNTDSRKSLIVELLGTQGGKCFICEKKLDPHLHGATIDIDHVQPLKTGGKDDPSDFQRHIPLVIVRNRPPIYASPAS